MPDYKIAPSILSADFARLGEEVDNVLESGADIHNPAPVIEQANGLGRGPSNCQRLLIVYCRPDEMAIPLRASHPYRPDLAGG